MITCTGQVLQQIRVLASVMTPYAYTANLTIDK